MGTTPGRTLGPYVLGDLIGSGGMGEVYRAHDARLQRDVAIKLLPVAFSQDPDRLQRFEQEARAAAALNHPNILSVYDVGAQNESPYIVSELLDGESLRDRLRKGPLPERKAIDYAIQLARGLAVSRLMVGHFMSPGWSTCEFSSTASNSRRAAGNCCEMSDLTIWLAWRWSVRQPSAPTADRSDINSVAQFPRSTELTASNSPGRLLYGCRGDLTELDLSGEHRAVHRDD